MFILRCGAASASAPFSIRSVIVGGLIATAIMAAAFAMQGCGREPDPVAPVDPFAHLRLDTFDCPLPIINGFDIRWPSTYYEGQRLSPDGRSVAHTIYGGGVWVTDLASGSTRRIAVESRLPAFVKGVAAKQVRWCPYDNNRLLVGAQMDIDTNGDRRIDLFGNNLYVVDIDGAGLTRVTPSRYGPYVAQSGLYINEWLVGSTPSVDSLHLYSPLGIYIPGAEEFVPDNGRDFQRQSRDGRRELGARYEAAKNIMRLTVNGLPLQLPTEIRSFSHASWSPDGRLLALSIKPDTDRWEDEFEQVWVVDVETYLRGRPMVAPVQIIDLQDRFCMYSLLGAYAEFVTNRTLAVTMHPDGGRTAHIYEITTDGRMVRQITR